MLNFFAVDFSISSSTLDLRFLYSEALFIGCSCTVCMFSIYWYYVVNSSLSCRIALAVSSLVLTDPVVWCLILSTSLVKKSLKLLQFFTLVGFSSQESHGRLKNRVSSMARYLEWSIFVSVCGSSPTSDNSLQSTMQVNSTVVGVVGSRCESNAISFSCSCFGSTVT